MFENSKIINRYYLYDLDNKIIDYKKNVLNDLLNRHMAGIIEYDEYYKGQEYIYYWGMMKEYKDIIKYI